MDKMVGGGDRMPLKTPWCKCQRGFNRRTHVYESHKYDPEACYSDLDDLEGGDE